MARGVNKVILIGNLGNDPDARMTPQGTPVTSLSVATDESYKDKNTGQMVPKTEWHKVVVFNRLAEIARDYLKKGSKVYIEGRLQTRKWQDQNGQDRYSTEIVGNELQMLDSKQDGQQGGHAQQGPQFNGQQQPNAQPVNQHQAQPSPHANNPQGYAQQQQTSYAQQQPGMQQSQNQQGAMPDDLEDIPFNPVDSRLI